jgi:hypothetical protein
MGYQFKNINNTQEISITRENNLSEFCYDAFKNEDGVKDYIYIGIESSNDKLTNIVSYQAHNLLSALSLLYNKSLSPSQSFKDIFGINEAEGYEKLKNLKIENS